MNKQPDDNSERARQILHRLTGSTETSQASDDQLRDSHIADRLAQIEQLFRLHGGERNGACGPKNEDILFDWGHLQALEQLGQGSFGEVYLAYDRTLDRNVALKLLKQQDQGPFQSQVFLHEARQLAMVRHPNVLAVHGAAIHDGRPGLWTDLIEGQTAHAPAYQDDLTGLDTSLGLIESLAMALRAVHAAGLVHGDVKPSNLMRHATGTWVLMDFGASLEQRTDFQSLPMSSGTPLYMAPEVAMGQAPTVEADRYAMGATLYRVLIGRAPFDASTWDDLKSAHAKGIRPPSAERSGKVDRRVGRLIDALMSGRPEQRTSPDAVLAQTRRIREAPQRRFRTAALSSIAALLVVGLTLTSIGFYRANEARIEAQIEQRNTAAVNRFLQRVLATPTTTGRVRSMTVQEMLEQAADDVVPELDDQPAAQAAVHRVLAESFTTLRLPEPALEQIDRARALIEQFALSMPVIERGLDLQAVRAFEWDNQHEHSLSLAEAFEAKHLNALGDEHRDIRWARMLQVTNHLSLSQFDDARQLLERYFADVSEPETADSHFDYAILKAWANVELMQGRYSEAAERSEQALAWLDRYARTRPIDRTGALSVLALTQTHLGNWDKAIDVMQQLIPLQETMFGEASDEVMATLINLSGAQREAGHVEPSGDTLRRARALILANPELFDGQQRLAIDMNLANVLNATGQQEEGEALIRDSILQAIDLWSDDHVNVLKLEYNLAELMHQQGRFEEARALAGATLAKKQQALGEEHPFTLLSMDNLAIALCGLGRIDEALEWHKRAYNGIVGQLGDSHPFALLIARHRLAALKVFAPEQLSATAMSELVERHIASLGADHPDTAKAQALLD